MEQSIFGAFYRRYDGKFYNTCGKTPSFTRWYPGQPDDHGNREKCGHMLVNGKYKAKWNDIACGSKYSYICEFKQPRCEYLATILRFKASIVWFGDISRSKRRSFCYRYSLILQNRPFFLIGRQI